MSVPPTFPRAVNTEQLVRRRTAEWGCSVECGELGGSLAAMLAAGCQAASAGVRKGRCRRRGNTRLRPNAPECAIGTVRRHADKLRNYGADRR